MNNNPDFSKLMLGPSASDDRALNERNADVAMAKEDDVLSRLRGRSFPSAKYGAWIVDRVSATIDGRSRLVTANLKGELWVWTRDLVEMFRALDSTEQPRLVVVRSGITP